LLAYHYSNDGTIMSHTDSTAQKFDTNFPQWLAIKLLAKEDKHSSGLARRTQKFHWRKEIEMELSELL